MASVSCSSRIVHCVSLPLPVLQEPLEDRDMDFADKMAQELIKMEVGSRYMSKAHAAQQQGSSLLLLCVGPQRPCCCMHCTLEGSSGNQVDTLHLVWHTLQHNR